MGTLVELLPNLPAGMPRRATYHQPGCRAVAIARGAKVTPVVFGTVVTSTEEACCAYCHGAAYAAACIARGQV